MKNVNKPTGLAALIGIAVTSSTGSYAANVLEEVVVTAQKREQNVQDVGIAITAFSGEQMRALGMNKAIDVAKFSPGLRFEGTAGGGYINLPTIRGVGQNDFQAHHEQPNAIYVDEVYISSPGFLDFSLFDSERAEVLRGPQGTLYGRNATGGLISFVPAKPKEEFGGYITAEYGSYNTKSIEAAVTGPLSDTVRGRLSANWINADGYVENQLEGEDDAFEQDARAIRGQLEFDFGDKITNRISVNYAEQPKHAEGYYELRPGDLNADGMPINLPRDTTQFGIAGCTLICTWGWDVRDTAPNDAFKSSFTPGYLEKDITLVSNHLTWDISDVLSLTSISAWQDGSFAYDEDCDGSAVEYCRFPATQELSQFTQELRLEGQLERMKWVGGLYYYDRTADQYTDYQFIQFGMSLQNTFSLDSQSTALFGQVEYDMSDTLTTIVGLRYTRDEMDFDSVTYNPDTFFCGVELCYQFDASTAGKLASRTDSEWSGKIQQNYRPVDDLLLYVSASKGTKGGGFNGAVDGTISFDNTPYDPETLYAYEGGSKWTINDSVRLNTSVFYYDYNDYQAFSFQSLTAIVQNRDATLYGSEIELFATLNGGIDIIFGAAFLESEVKDVTIGDTLYDRETPKSPKASYTAMLRKNWDMDFGQIAAQVDGQYVGQQYSSVSNTPATKMDSYYVGNARISYISNEGWEISAYVNNLFDEEIQTYAYDSADPASLGYNLASYARPRWYGLQFTYKFGAM